MIFDEKSSVTQDPLVQSLSVTVFSTCYIFSTVNYQPENGANVNIFPISLTNKGNPCILFT